MTTAPIRYTPSPSSANDVRYDVGATNWHTRFGEDPVLGAEPHTLRGAAGLAESESWEDRVRALVMAETAARRITLPDGFPCIFEDETSPHRQNVLHPRIFAWVVSPDHEMLAELLPLYQELWDAYQSQWPSPGRQFKLGRLNGLAPHSVYRPGTTVEQVIAQTLLTHDGMYARAPEHLKVMHPLHTRWTAARKERMSALAQEGTP